MSLEQIQVTPSRRDGRVLLRCQGGKAPSRLVDVTVSLDAKEGVALLLRLEEALKQIDVVVR